MIKSACILSTVAIAAVSVSVTAEVRLPQFLTDNMVVQQNSELIVSGEGKGGVKVSASWLDEPIVAEVSRGGKFKVFIPTPEAGGPWSISFSDNDGTKTLSDVWSGEVWLCSGQSNMEMPVGGWGKIKDYEKEISNATLPQVHLLQIRKSTAFEPQDDAEVNMGGWRICSPETVSEFSSIAYFFARELNRQLGVHVGVIDATWGGTPAEAWTALGGVETVAGFEKECSMLRDAKGSDKKMNRFHSDRIAAWNAAVNGKKNNFRHSEISANSMKTELPGFVERDIENFNGVFVLQRYVDIPASFAGKDLTLRLAKIDDEDVTYFNGVEVGRTSGYDTPRSYTVPGKLVKAGRNLISIEVTDFEGEGGLYGAPDDMWLANGEARIPLAGEWGCSVVADFSECAPRPVSPGSSSFPTVLFNAMIHPLKDFPVKGVIWYQGCANVGRAEQYAPLFTNLVKTWRETRRQPDMPFYFMQLAGFLAPKTIQPDSDWAALREAQTAACVLPGVRMATAIDIGNPDDIHPKNKQEAARRFALIALNDAYGFKDVTAYAPVLKSCTMNNGETLLEFDSPVTVDGVAPAGFIACVSSGGWERPEIRMEGRGKVYLRASSPIKEIRYNWADCPDGNLRGFTGLPVAPFKTEVK